MVASPLALAAAVALALSQSAARASPCCNGGAAAPGIISGDERALVSATLSHGSVIGDAPDEGLAVFRSDRDHDRSQSLRLEGAHLASDRWQLGAGMSWVRREIDRSSLRGSASLPGDARLSAAYEALPEWSYSEWIPKGHVFASLTLPTGRSLYESRASTEADATGKGFFMPAGGMLLTKRWRRWDAFAIPQVAFSLPRSFEQEDGSDLRVAQGFGASLALGGGFTWRSRTRFGARLAPSFQQGRRVSSPSGDFRAPAQRVIDASIDLSHLVADDWTLAASYTDQTLVGPARNTTLSRSVGVSLQRAWQR